MPCQLRRPRPLFHAAATYGQLALIQSAFWSHISPTCRRRHGRRPSFLGAARAPRRRAPQRRARSRSHSDRVAIWKPTAQPRAHRTDAATVTQMRRHRQPPASARAHTRHRVSTDKPHPPRRPTHAPRQHANHVRGARDEVRRGVRDGSGGPRGPAASAGAGAPPGDRGGAGPEPRRVQGAGAAPGVRARGGRDGGRVRHQGAPPPARPLPRAPRR